MAEIRFDGVINFRDFGGALGAEGRRVRRGRLFRSGHHGAATDDDMAKLAKLDLALIVDLRRAAERARDPARRPSELRAEVLEHDGPAGEVLAPHLAFLAAPDASPARVNAQMIEGYRNYPFDPPYVALYRRYFERMAVTDGPVFLNCHAGKDRTGFLCALTLHLLGVSREDIYADYLATNRFNRADERVRELAAQFQKTHGQPVSEDLLRSVMRAEPAYLDAAFAAIDARHEDIDHYFAEALGVTPPMREAARARFLD